MNENQSKPEPEGQTPPEIPAADDQRPPDEAKKSKLGCGGLLLGGVACIALLIAGVFTRSNIVCLSLPPVVGLALTIRKQSRVIGLGIVITYCLLWLIFWAFCGHGRNGW
jgi:hypothetical protein